jgi:hypothetical protein
LSRGSHFLRILHGPTNIGNQPWALSRAERRLGNVSDLVVLSESWTKYPADKTLCEGDIGEREKTVRSFRFGLLALLRYDLLHYYFGLTFLYHGLFSIDSTDETMKGRIRRYLATIDLRLARWFGRRRFMTLQGCDARLAGEGNRRNEWTMCAAGRCSAYPKCIDMLDAQRRGFIRNVLPLFDRVFYLNPELGHVVPQGQFLPYANVEIEKIEVALPSNNERPRVLHAPSDGSIKGTSMILGALEQLKSRYDFELILVENKTHKEAMALYRSADLAIDQVLAGWYGGFAVEMMAMGKPVACYIREEDMKFVSDGMKHEMPIFRIDPGRLVEDIATVFEQRAEWRSRGRMSRRYVERWHNPEIIAEAMIACYQDANSDFELNPDIPSRRPALAGGELLIQLRNGTSDHASSK